MARPWIFTLNTFKINTENNFKKMLSLDADHFGKMTTAASGGDPDYVTILADYTPFHNGYVNLYAEWQGNQGSHEGSTLNVETLFADLNTNLRVWEGKVRSIFAEDTPNEKSIFPNKRKPFQEGTYEQRISAIKTLYEKLATFTTEPVLVTLSGTVQTFYNLISAARNTQQGGEASISNTVSLLESQRILCATAMYGTLGRLMYKYRSNPSIIEGAWDMALLRDTETPDYTAEINTPTGITAPAIPAGVLAVIETDTLITLTNNSAAEITLTVSFSTNSTASGPVTVNLIQNEVRQLSATELGWSPDRQALIISNPAAETGNLKIEIEL